jgi:hypothetical protein
MKKERGYQVSVVLKPDLRDRFIRAMELENRRKRADLLYTMVKEWLTDFEKKRELKAPEATLSKRVTR